MFDTKKGAQEALPTMEEKLAAWKKQREQKQQGRPHKPDMPQQQQQQQQQQNAGRHQRLLRAQRDRQRARPAAVPRSAPGGASIPPMASSSSSSSSPSPSSPSMTSASSTSSDMATSSSAKPHSIATSSAPMGSASFPANQDRGMRPRPRDVCTGKENEAAALPKRTGHTDQRVAGGASKRKCETNSYNAKAARHTQLHHASLLRRPGMKTWTDPARPASTQDGRGARASGRAQSEKSSSVSTGASEEVVNDPTRAAHRSSASCATQTSPWPTRSVASQTVKPGRDGDRSMAPAQPPSSALVTASTGSLNQGPTAMETSDATDGEGGWSENEKGLGEVAKLDKALQVAAMDANVDSRHGEDDDDDDTTATAEATGDRDDIKMEAETETAGDANGTPRPFRAGSGSCLARTAFASVHVQTMPELDVKPECRSVGASTCARSDFTEETAMQTSSPDSAATPHREDEPARSHRRARPVQHCAIQTDHKGWMAPPQEVLDALRFGNSLLEQKTAQLEGKVNMLEATLTLKERQLVMEREDFAKRVEEVRTTMQTGLVQSVARIKELERELAEVRASHASSSSSSSASAFSSAASSSAASSSASSASPSSPSSPAALAALDVKRSPSSPTSSPECKDLHRED